MNTPKVSVIVPCYNREKYIEQCIGSLLSQSLNDIEIIFVNDGSTDNSRGIVANLAKNDERIQIIDQPNQGVATARNSGLKHASASYIMWCDSDDMFDPKMCEKMYSTIINETVDVAVCGMKLQYDGSKKQKEIEEYVKLKFSGKQQLGLDQILNTDVSLPTKIFKKSVIDKYNMSFPDGLHYEDAFFCDQYFAVAESIFYLNENLYTYVRHENSIMSRSLKKEAISQDYIKIIPKTYNFLKSNRLFDANADMFWQRFRQYYAFTFNNVDKVDRPIIRGWAIDFINNNREDFEKADPKIQKSLWLFVTKGKNHVPLKSRIYSIRLIRTIWTKIVRPMVKQ